MSETAYGADGIAYGLSLQLRSGADLANFEAVRVVREIAELQATTGAEYSLLMSELQGAAALRRDHYR